MSLMVLRVLAAIVEARLIVVLQVGADALHVGDDVDAVLTQQIGRADAGQLQQLRRVERAAREDHLGVRARRVRRAVLAVFDADRAAPLEQDARGQRIRHHREIAALARGREIAARGRPAPALARGELEIAGAFLARAVEIVGARDAGLSARRR